MEHDGDYEEAFGVRVGEGAIRTREALSAQRSS